MIITEITQKFIKNPNYLKNGAGFLAQAWGCTKEEIYEAKTRARTIMSTIEGWDKWAKIKGGEKPVFEMEEREMPEVDILSTPKYTGSETTDTGTVKKFESDSPLNPKEIEELAGVDNINTYVARVWDKLLPSGKWVYSIDVRYRVKDFYTKEQLQAKLKELMPDMVALFQPPTSNITSKKALVICLADDHAGAVNVTNLFDNPAFTYQERLNQIFYEIADLDEKSFDEIHVVSLGDQMNGWSSQTTRGGHEIKSLSNQEQFDIYVGARVNFYNKLFTSGLSENYFVHDVENSNHSGLGMSYMANKALEMYLEGKFPFVFRESINEMIGGFQYGKHVVLMGHGKDEKFQIRPMPAVLNDKTDLYLYDYAQNKGYSPYGDHITFYKGDLHQHGVQNGKFGRYVNVQSIAGNSDYGDLNFGNTKGGALLEILHKESYKISSQPIWF